MSAPAGDPITWREEGGSFESTVTVRPIEGLHAVIGPMAAVLAGPSATD